MKKIIIIFCTLLIDLFSMAQKKITGFNIVDDKQNKQVDIFFNGKLLTAYCYYDSIRKPFLYPVNTLDGITVTRGYPIRPLVGERTDHPHHTGIWMNYESVNGLDFWNNSTAIPIEKRNLYGTISHESIVTEKANKNKASLIVTANWLRPDGHVLIMEETTYLFNVRDNYFFIDRKSVLIAMEQDVVFKDAKDGFFAIRVARELEMPSQQADVFVDALGNKTAVPKLNNEGVTGMYYNSDGIKGDSVWSTKGRWAMLKGQKEGKEITIGIFDHPKNVGYPAYWHARGYGLFAINPLGRKIFSNGKEELNYTLPKNKSVTFHYRILIASGKEITANEMNKLANEFAKEK
ncbi:MAG: PmoA family protein [Bacteroidota bacterium]|nr:PmoA family protein [Bacteroidota bacterium]